MSEAIQASDPTGIVTSTDGALAKFSEADLSTLITYATKNLGPAILHAGLGLGVIFLGYLVASYAARLVGRPVCRRVDETLGRFISNVTFYGILCAVTGAVLAKLGAPLGALAAMLAAAGFAIGLAFQGTLSNFAAGVLMLVFRPFKVGDLINAGGVSGKVNEIDLFTTTLDTPDNRRIVVPNSSIAGGTIENISYHPHRRIEVLVGVDYSADLDATRAALEAALARFKMVTIQGDGRGAVAVLAGLGAGLGNSAVQWKVRMWVAAENYWGLHESLVGEVKRQLDAATIRIPHPQLEIHYRGDKTDVGSDRNGMESEMIQVGEQVSSIDRSTSVAIADESGPERPRIRPIRRDPIDRDPGDSPLARAS